MSSALFDAPLLPAGVWFIPRRDPGNQWGAAGPCLGTPSGAGNRLPQPGTGGRTWASSGPRFL